jgi:enoyl-CoA hydratase/carnithine racemase
MRWCVWHEMTASAHDNAVTVISLNSPAQLASLSQLGAVDGIKAMLFVLDHSPGIADAACRSHQWMSCLDSIKRRGTHVVAALRGSIGGEALVFALACDARALAKTSIIVIPEAGQTFSDAALNMASEGEWHGLESGRRLDAMEALELGLVDVVVEGGLKAAAIDFALVVAGSKARCATTP